MGIGAYRHVVTLADLDPAVVLDPPTWHCAVQSAAGQVVDGLAAFYVRGRFHPGITLETQIDFEGRTLQVQSVNDVDERHENLELLCVEAVARGSNPGTTPTITTSPQDVTVFEGESAMLAVVAAGTPPLAYQWTEAGVDLAGATSASYLTGPLTVTSVYAVRVSNIYSTVTSPPATVTVEPPLDYQETVLADGATAYWPMDEAVGSTTARELVGGATADITGGVTLGTPGPVAGTTAMLFDGLTGQLATSVLLPMPVTIEAWIRRDAPHPNDRESLIIGLPFDPNIRWPKATTGYIADPMDLFLKATVNLSGQLVECPTLIGTTWHHAVYVFAADGIRVYLDGVLDGQAPYVQLGQADSQVTVGYDAWGGLDHWFGSLCDVALYPRELTPAEVTKHYALRLAGRRR